VSEAHARDSPSGESGALERPARNGRCQSRSARLSWKPGCARPAPLAVRAREPRGLVSLRHQGRSGSVAQPKLEGTRTHHRARQGIIPPCSSTIRTARLRKAGGKMFLAARILAPSHNHEPAQNRARCSDCFFHE
jgi:hypothetical protein